MSTIALTEDNFVSTIEDNSIVLIDFWAEWCAPCRMFGPVFEQSSEQHDDIVFAKVDTEAQQNLAGAMGITSIPTLMAFREGIGVFAQPGAMQSASLEKLIEAIRDLDMDEVRAQIEQQQKDAATN